MKLIWHADNLLEVDWLRAMFAGAIEGELTDLDLTCYVDDSIHVVSSNWKPLATYESYFRECRARCRHIVLFHASDEWFSGSYELYRYFDLVIRAYHTYLAADSAIVTIPQGYTNGTRIDAWLPADARKYAWSFSGEIKASRIAMHSAFAGFVPEFVARTNIEGHTLSKDEYDTVLGETVFAPCPMGNVIMETWRLYESLELGCIPLVETRLSLNYYERLFGQNPIPSFRRWTDARRYAEAAFADKPGLVRKQREITDWWTSHKAAVRAKIHEALAGPSRASSLQRYGKLIRNRFTVLYEPLRLTELLRHQTGGSLRRRLTRPVGPLKRIIRDVAKTAPANGR